MNETPIESDHSTFSPKDYLRQYYSTPELAGDDIAIIRTLNGWMRRRYRTYNRAIEVGCGPTIHHAASLVPWVNEVDLCEFLPANRAEVQSWLDGRPDAHNWRPYIRGILQIERAGGPVADDDVEERQSQLRAKVSRVLPCDLLANEPLGQPAQYELVASFFTVECAAGSRDRWPAAMGHLLDLVSPGGALFIGTMWNCSWYSVLGKHFPAAAVTEEDYAALLPQHGFPPFKTQIEVVPIPDWADEGFDRILIVSAERE